MYIQQGPGFPLTRKRERGFSESLVIYIIIALLVTSFGLDSVELGRFIEFLKTLNVPITLS